MVHPAIPLDTQHPNLLNGLIAKRAEISGEIEAKQAALRKLVTDLATVEATIRLFDPNVNLNAVVPRRQQARHVAFKGELTRAVFDCLREAEKPMTVTEIACFLITRKRLAPNEKGAALMAKRVRDCLRDKRRQGVLRSVRNDGPFLGWELVR